MDFFLFLKMNFAEGKEGGYFEFRFGNGAALWQIDLGAAGKYVSYFPAAPYDPIFYAV